MGKTFVNERGNKITVSARRVSRDQVKISLTGPKSKTTNTVTDKEAKVMCSQVARVLRGEVL